MKPPVTIGRWVGTALLAAAVAFAGPTATLTSPANAATATTFVLATTVTATVSAGADDWVVGHVVTNDGTTPVVGDQVTLESSTDGGSTWSSVAAATTDDQGGVAFDEQPETSIDYQLTDTSGAGVGTVGPIESVYATVDGDPEGFNDIAFEPTNGGADAFWSPPSDDGGSPIAAYSFTANGTTKTRDASGRSADITGLQNGQTYSVSLTVTNEAGASATQTDTITPESTAPDPSYNTPCGALPSGTTTLSSTTANYTLCPIGIIAGPGSTLVIDATGGPINFALNADNDYGGIVAQGGDLRTVGTTPGAITLTDVPIGTYTTGFKIGSTGSAVTIADVTVDHGNVAFESDVYADVSNFDSNGAAIVDTGTPTMLTDSSVEADAADNPEPTYAAEFDCACKVDITGLTTSGDAGGVSVAHTSDLTLTDVDVTNTSGVNGDQAIYLNDLTASIGPGADVDADTGENDASPDILFFDVTVTNSFTWVTPGSDTSDDLPLGYVGQAETMTAGTTLTVGANQTAAIGGLVLNQATLDASAGGAQLTGDIEANDSSVTIDHGTLACPTDTDGIDLLTGVDGDVDSSPPTVTVTDSTVSNCDTGISAGGVLPGTLAITGSTFHADDNGVASAVPITATITGSQLTGTLQTAGAKKGTGISIDAESGVPETASDDQVSEFAVGVVTGGDHPQLDDITVSHNTLAGEFDGAMDLGAGGDVTNFDGSANTYNAVALSAGLTASATWISPTQSATDSPIGWYVDGDLEIDSGATLTVPADGVVKVVPSSSAPDSATPTLTDITIAGSLIADKGSVITSLADPSVDPWLCPVDGSAQCLSELPAWGGLESSGSTTITDGAVRYADIRSSGTLSVTGSTLTQTDIIENQAPSTVITGDVLISSRIDTTGMSGTTITVDDDHIEGMCEACLNIDSGSDPGDGDATLNVSDDRIDSDGGVDAAAILTVNDDTVGPGDDIGGFTGSGENAVVEIDGTVSGKVSWLPADPSLKEHALGYVSTGLTVADGGDLVFPANALIQIGLLQGRNGATIDASAGGDRFVGWSGDELELASPCLGGCPPTSIVGGTGSGSDGGQLLLDKDTVVGAVGGDDTVPSDDVKTAGLSIDNTAVTGALDTSLSKVVATGSSIAGGVSELYGTADFSQDDVSGATADGLSLTSLDTATLANVTADDDFAGVYLTGLGSGSLSCLHVSGDSVAGIQTQGPADAVVSDSVLTGSSSATNGAYDFANSDTASADDVYWGQSTGPLPDQIETPASFTDTAPAKTAPSCAGDQSTAPTAVSAVKIKQLSGDDIAVSWTPATTGPAPTDYHVVVSGAGEPLVSDAPPSADSAVVDLSADIPGGFVTRGSVTASVEAISAAGISAQAKSPVTQVNQSTLTVTVTGPKTIDISNDTAVPVSGTAPAGSLVEVDVSLDSQHLVAVDTIANSSGDWKTTVNASDMPDGEMALFATAYYQDAIDDDLYDGETSTDKVASAQMVTATPMIDDLTAAVVTPTNKTEVAVVGTATPGGTVAVRLTEGTVKTAVVVGSVDAAGDFAVSVNAAGLREGEITAAADETNPAGTTSSPASVSDLDEVTAPVEPVTALKASVSGKKLLITWKSPAASAHSVVTGYAVTVNGKRQDVAVGVHKVSASLPTSARDTVVVQPTNAAGAGPKRQVTVKR